VYLYCSPTLLHIYLYCCPTLFHIRPQFYLPPLGALAW
jgi:hypothetical protein